MNSYMIKGPFRLIASSEVARIDDCLATFPYAANQDLLQPSQRRVCFRGGSRRKRVPVRAECRYRPRSWEMRLGQVRAYRGRAWQGAVALRWRPGLAGGWALTLLAPPA